MISASLIPEAPDSRPRPSNSSRDHIYSDKNYKILNKSEGG